MCVYVCACVCACMCMYARTTIDLRTTLWDQFYPVIFYWIIRIELRSLGLYSRHPSTIKSFFRPPISLKNASVSYKKDLTVCDLLSGAGVSASACPHLNKLWGVLLW